MKYCCSYYDLKENVCSLVGSFPKRNEKKNFDFYTLEEFNKFIKCVDDEVYKQYFSTLFKRTVLNFRFFYKLLFYVIHT